MADKRKSSYSKKRESSLTKKDAQDKIKKLFDQKLQGATGSQRITVSAGARSRSTMARESRAMSAVGSNKMSVKKDNMDSNQRAEAGALEAHLRAIQPFNECWFVESTISAGTYGVAFRVLHKNEKTKAVIKVARSLSGSANSAAEWEAFVLEKMWRREPGANIVRILDKGMLQDQNDEALEFMARNFKGLLEVSELLLVVSAGARSRSTMARESRAMSAVGSNKMSVKKDNMDSNQRAEAGALEAHLRAIQPFNECWFVESTISAGTYGVAFRVLHKNEKTKAVIKVARSLSGSANSAAEWEAFVLEKIVKPLLLKEPGANIVRILDKGMLQDQNDEALEFMALEFCDTSVREYINGAKGFERKERVCRVALGSLKGLYDLHANGFLHRDMKPDNMGMITKPDLDPVCVLYDLGMARMYTDGDGNLRTPRTICPFRGTPEWASGHSIKGREQVEKEI
uniref:Protein kinase domain-containing protein n=1 Tax=Meloidogyne javanica TaxID=6303 RepID=A0A915MTF4_MELJA